MAAVWYSFGVIVYLPYGDGVKRLELQGMER
jgi:hypothetical protein